jgi:hypothetical protein
MLQYCRAFERAKPARPAVEIRPQLSGEQQRVEFSIQLLEVVRAVGGQLVGSSSP